MPGYLSEQEHQELVDELAAGRASVQLSRHASRHFFLRVSSREVSETIDSSVIGQKFIVLGSLTIAIALIATSLGMLLLEQSWLAMFSVPLVGIFWTVIAGFTTEYGSMLSSTLLLLVAFAIAWVLPAGYQLPLVTFALSLFFYRLGHIAAQYFLKHIVTSSYQAWDMLAEHITVRRPADQTR